MSRRLMVLIAGAFAVACSDDAEMPAAPEVGFAAHTAEYVAIDLGTLGGSGSVATGITNSGVIVGTSTDAEGRPQAFRWTSRGGLESLAGALGSGCSSATAVNNGGDIVGWVRTQEETVFGCPGQPLSAPRAFRLTSEGTVLTGSNDLRGPAVAVNNNGDVLVSMIFTNVLWTSDNSEVRICPGYDMDLRSLTSSRIAYGSAYARQLTGWAGVSWAALEPTCVNMLGTDSYLTIRTYAANENGMHVGVGVGVVPDPTFEGGLRPTAASAGYAFSPTTGYAPLTFTPYALNERGDIVGAAGDLAVLRTRQGETISLGPGRPLAMNNFGDVVGVSGAGRAVLWTRRADNYPGGVRLMQASRSALAAISRREAESRCTGRHAVLVAMDAFPECPAPTVSRDQRRSSDTRQ